MIHKTRNRLTYCNATRGRLHHSHAVNMQRKLYEVWKCGSQGMIVDKQTGKQTDKLITILHSPTRAEL